VTVRHARFTANTATRGAAVNVDGPLAKITLQTCTFELNNATDEGGALYVASGAAVLSNTTSFAASNVAASGNAYFLGASNEAEIMYALPAPAAHYISNPFECRKYAHIPSHQWPCDLTKYPELEGLTVAMLGRGAFDSAFPLECPAGILGSSEVADQQGPGCGSLCPAGSYCPRASSTAIQCPSGTYCMEGSPLPTLCAAGTYRSAAGGIAATDCMECPAGSACIAGSSTPMPCSPGTIANTTEQATCANCLAGTFQDAEGQTACKPCTAGYYCTQRTAEPRPCPGGTHKDPSLAVMTDVSQCVSCPAGTFCYVGSASPSQCPLGTFNPWLAPAKTRHNRRAARHVRQALRVLPALPASAIRAPTQRVAPACAPHVHLASSNANQERVAA